MCMTLNTRTGLQQTVFIDAGIENILIELSEVHQAERKTVQTESIANTRSLAEILLDAKLYNTAQANKDTYITGKLADTVRNVLGYGICIKPAAALWQAARKLLSSSENSTHDSVGIIEISASGYTILAVDRDGGLKDNMLVTNPHCGAGSGINLSRVLQKLDIERDKVDMLLTDYLGSEGAKKRQAISPRADRCGVFSSSATVSDKNQGIPLDYALATTIKSEVLKACRKLTNGIDHVYLTGGIFRWQYARDCAEDFLKSERQIITVTGMSNISLPLLGVSDLVDTIGAKKFRESEEPLKQVPPLSSYPGFTILSKEYKAKGRYLRLASPPVQPLTPELSNRAVNMGLDVGSTMAKVILSDAADDQLLWVNSYVNHGDTIATIKYIFKELVETDISSLNIQNIGITGSGRYQVQKVLSEVYPHLNERIRVLVENYAHARGSIDEARQRIADLQADGKDINTETAVLVDVGGEDTKISVIDLERGELLDNAMNIKCSAGTGSLMDTIMTLFGIESIQEACSQAYEALQAYNINATCAVFLMENASKMRAEGYPIDEIMGSCYWAIVENMARTLWSQIKMPAKPLLLLHGQTMLSEPLPLAVTKRMHSFTESDVYALVPGLPGHRACIGLIKSIPVSSDLITEASDLNLLIERTFEKKIITCRGTACGDKNSRCNRVKLTFYSQEDEPQSISLGGCSAVNDLFSKKSDSAKKSDDAYRKLWSMVDSALPRSEQSNRLVIPRSFAASEQAFFLSSILGHLGLPVHVDNVVAADVIRGQRFFDLDACAPNIGATGQMQRLASRNHGMILIPQIDYLPTNSEGKGRTCTVNQGGCVIAMRFAQQQYPDAVMHLFDLDLHSMDAVRIAAQIHRQWQTIFSQYGINPSKQKLISAVRHGLHDRQKLDEKVANTVTFQLAEALADGRDIAITCGREYVLNPGVYDSHIGRLFRDKGVVAIPSYILNVELSRDFNQLYWRNPHQIVTIIDAVKNKKLHTIIKHKPMADMIRQLEENESKSKLGLSLVSTFSCGPDSISLPLIQELTQSLPFILVQSDGAIQELAHLENRINTYLRQLTDQTRRNINDREFSIELLNDFTLDKLNPETDVIYIPTMGDNRVITSVLRAAGLTCIDNFTDETYDPQELITRGRQYTGDSLCAPFAAVFGDTLRAVEDFIERRKNGEFTSQHRVLIFNNKGSGPCRQGLYDEMHRLLLDRDRRKEGKQKKGADDPTIKYMVALES